uniref:Elongation factor G n=1 Tax=candidate division WOR-3 bacterium TaxID=2052148 RepID=A0A7V3VUD3_UNCW3
MEQTRFKNIGFFGHAGCGKTTLADGFVFLCGANTRFGKVSDGTSIFDIDPDEQKRGCSLSLGLATFDYKNITFNLIDTPGYADFVGDMLSALYAVDVCVVVVDATTGIAVGTERVLNEATKRNLPFILFINKLKKENTDFYEVLKSLNEITKRKIVPLNIPIGTAEKFEGVANIVTGKVYITKDGKTTEAEIPQNLRENIGKYQELFIECAADMDDNLMNKYLETGSLSIQECIPAFKRAIIENKVAPCFCGEGLELIGVQDFINMVMEFIPSYDELPDIEINGNKIKRGVEEPFLGYIFKTMVEAHMGEICYVKVLSGKINTGDNVSNTTQNSEEKIAQIYFIKGKEKKETNTLSAGMIAGLVKLKNTHTGDTLSKSGIKLPPIEFPTPSISMAIVPKAKGDEEKISNGLAKLRAEDPTFNFAYDHEIKQLIISGVGELHLDVILSRLQRKYGVNVELTRTKIKYRETFTKKTEAQGKYKKQTGGHGQYGDCWLRVEPLPRGSGIQFAEEIFGGAIPARYIPSVEKGVREALEKGYLAGYPITDVKVTVYDGSYHPVDSSDIAFQIAAAMAIKANAEKGNVVLLEPIMEVEVYVPEEFMGDVIGDLNSRRGKIMGMEAMGKIQVVKAMVPEAEMYKYSTSLRSMTQGRGYFTMKFHHYEEVPKEIAQKVIEEAKKENK